ncbi:hypothetical protein B0J14DRAFT_492102 [Halenospora varia]|nr:hypothetical protein B0J14DRAFT_492102 [Halenospora varia]
MESHRRLSSSSIDPASVESILSSGAPQPAAPPSPHVGNSPNRAQFAMFPPPRPISHHSRALSYTSRRPNRLSLSFPVATNSSSESARGTPTSSNATSFPPTPAEIVPTPSPNDPSGFLVALAGQERRVLELKEELHKAEADLKKLKKEWALHEAHKKKAEIRNVEPMRPVQLVSTDSSPTDGDTTSARQSAELDRRKALLSNINIPKESRRKIITGGHTRTLSLLSPERSNYPRPFPPVREHSSERQESITRSGIMPDTSQGISRVSTIRARPLSYQGGVTHGAKQIAEDLKAGMWTFLEDLRQATVGDEAVNGNLQRTASCKGPVKKGSKGSLRGDKIKRSVSPRITSPRTWETLTGPALLDAAGTLWSESDTGTNRPAAKTPVTAKKTSRPISLAAPALDDLDDDWSNWDSPTPKSPRWSGSSTMSTDPATPSNASIDDRNVKIAGESSGGADTPSKREPLQWPALDNLTPTNLKRTMSSMMKEWEKTLTPPLEEQRERLVKWTTTSTDEEVTSSDGGSQLTETTTEEALMMSR